MNVKELKHELQNIISRNELKGETNTIKAAQSFLSTSIGASKKIEGKYSTRTEEERALVDFATLNKLWVKKETLINFLAEGAEQKVFFQTNENTVYKIADAIFYTTWFDYFNNLLVHNTLFPNTAYELIGFIKENKKLEVVIKQQYIIASEHTNLNLVREFLEINGFRLKKNNDYYHTELGLILEDLHDENVLTNNNTLFFIDTVIYLTDTFWSE